MTFCTFKKLIRVLKLDLKSIEICRVTSFSKLHNNLIFYAGMLKLSVSAIIILHCKHQLLVCNQSVSSCLSFPFCHTLSFFVFCLLNIDDKSLKNSNSVRGVYSYKTYRYCLLRTRHSRHHFSFRST